MAYYRSTRIKYAVILALVLVLGHATFLGWAFALVVVGLLATIEIYSRRMAVGRVAAEAAGPLLAGDPDAAALVLDRARAAKVPLHAAPLAVASIEAEIALLRGRLDEVRRGVDAALRLPRDRFDPVSDAAVRRELTAVGALARATCGDADGALLAAATLEADELASLRAQARATLARGVTLARASRRVALGELLRDRRALLDLGASAPERSLARALARLARSPASSVYRRSAADKPEDDADWVRAAAGDAANLVPPRDVPGGPLTAEPAVARNLPAAGPAPSAGWRGVALWASLVAVILAAFEINRSPARPGAPHDAAGLPLRVDLAVAAVIVLAGAALVRRVRRSFRAFERMPRLLAAYARGDEAQALAGLQAMTRDPNQVLAATAWLWLSAFATLRGDVAAARTAAESGLGRLATKEVREATGDRLYPELIGQWAFAFAASGDAAAARGALAAMPDHGRAVRARFRVELLARWREGDETGAVAWARRGQRDDSVGAEDELLADAIRVAKGGDGLSGAERARILEEVASPRWRCFLDGVAPGLAQRVLALSAEAPADAPELEVGAEREAAAEREATAEEEIERGSSVVLDRSRAG